MKRVIVIAIAIAAIQVAQAQSVVVRPAGAQCPPGMSPSGHYCIQYKSARAAEMERISKIQDQIMRDSRERDRVEREILQRRRGY